MGGGSLKLLIARSATSVGLALKSSCLCVTVCCVCLTHLGSIPFGLQQGVMRMRIGVLDAKIMFLLFLTKNGPVSNRLSHKDFRIGGPKNYSF